ncbi:MAG: formylglycine-generating enzyme family protein [Bacteroidia bacterium]|nr:formylglycine-generating enzyme family protein [Bacteroidia bacterium]
MTFKCKIGLHTWDGCKCSACGKVRKDQHDWSKDCDKCSKCSNKRENQHDWSKDCEKCSICGNIRENQHDLSKDCEKCAKCGKTASNNHNWSKNCEKCYKCDTYRENKHKWDGNICSKCGLPKIDWVEIPAGTFTMGSPSSEVDRWDAETQHHVTLSAFKMSKYEVTFEQYDLFCEYTNTEKPDDEGWGRGKRPVINVCWHNAVAFATWMGCRLPTEAEWEYACRAGTTTPFNTGNNLTTWRANYNGDSPYNNYPKGELREKTMPVGSFSPNEWGLYDMHGNVAEWCSDWYDDYSIAAQTNPQGSEKKLERVIRGGSWDLGAAFCRSACRFFDQPDYQNNHIGFRLVSPLSSNESKLNENVDSEVIYKRSTPIITNVSTQRPSIQWVGIPMGEFIMGSPTFEVERCADEKQHKVSIGPFLMSKYAITFEQYDQFCEATGSKKPNDEGWGRGRRPVVNVDWYNSEAFADWMGCRLPTEAEWEYACRAGSKTPFNTGYNLTTSQANYAGYHPYNNNPIGESRGKTMPVGSFAPNAWGLYDMHGNVCEWCSDWYGEYLSGWQHMPTGRTFGFRHVFRGGGWLWGAQYCRSALRDFDFLEYHSSNFIGFRLVTKYNPYLLSSSASITATSS